MNRGLLYKSIREVWPATLLCGLLAAAFEGLVAVIFPNIQQQMGAQVMSMEFVKRIVEGMLGTKIADQLGPEILQAVPWAHPILLAIVLSHALISCTRLPSGEVDRGTIDVALGLPITRWRWMWTDTLVCVLGSMTVIGMALIGSYVGSSIAEGDRGLSLSVAAMIYVNLLGLCLVFGSAAWLLSSLGDRRGKAITMAFVLIVVSFLVSYLEQLWDPAGYVSWLSALSYYRPLVILRDGAWPVGDLMVLYGAAAVLWGSAAAVFCRRDLCTT